MKIICIVCVILFSNCLRAQLVEKDIIIVFNEKVEKRVSSMITLDLKKKEEVKFSFNARYTPGAMVFDSAIFAEAEKIDYDKIDITMMINKIYPDGTVDKRPFAFSISRDWMNATYIIVNIFDIKIKKYRKLFRSKSNYIYEMESDIGNVTAIRKKR